MKKFSVSIFLLAFFSPFLTLEAQSVDLLWQGKTYTPPFYEGSPLWSYQSEVTLLAVPQGVGSQANLNYRWIQNGTVLGNSSGVGKNSYSFFDTVLSRTQNIKVEITSQDNYDSPILAQASVTLRPSAPGIAAYENNPLYGFMFHQEILGTYPLEEGEATFTAFPLFFEAKRLTDSALTYKWQSSGTETETKSSVTYRVPEKGAGTSAVSVNISNGNRILQTASRNFLIQFGNE